MSIASSGQTIYQVAQAALRNAIAQRDANGALTATRQIASQQLVGLGLVLGANAITANYTVALTDFLIEANATSGNIAVQLLAAAVMAGQLIVVKKTDSSGNTVTITPNGSDTIDGASTKVISVQYKLFALMSDGTSWQVLWAL